MTIEERVELSRRMALAFQNNPVSMKRRLRMLDEFEAGRLSTATKRYLKESEK